MSIESKIHPRNLTARQSQRTAGNPVTTLLESGVGNCFPGLEMDIRNLERRFFPFLAVDPNTLTATIMNVVVADVDIDAARKSRALTPRQLAIYERLHRDTADHAAHPKKPRWLIRKIRGNFGPFGDRLLDMDTLGPSGRQPADPWTAIMLTPEGGRLTLSLSLGRERNAATATLVGRRQAYLDKTGALNSFFKPGEMTQSLCSPWTHDFRDCGCHYWASNHPDIVQLEKPANAAPAFKADRMVPWERSIKGSYKKPPAPARADQDPDEMAYYEISHRWHELAIILDGREQGGVYAPDTFEASPLPSLQTAVEHLHYAAGVELGVMQEYLTAAFSLRSDATGKLGDDIRAVRSEIMRIAIGEMRHLRVVNDVLRGLSDAKLTDSYKPALRVAKEIPAGEGKFRLVLPRALTPKTLTDFINIERPSFSVDGVYGHIFATLKKDKRVPGSLTDALALIIAEGNEHFETFSYIQDWLKPYKHPSDYLTPAKLPDAKHRLHLALQAQYGALLKTLYDAYQAGIPNGAKFIAQARTQMLSGIAGACRNLASAGLLVRFDISSDPDFAPYPRP
jgi:Ferritin-like